MESSLEDIPKLGTATPDIGVEEEIATEESLDKPWNIIVHNDPINLMSYVIMVFMRVFGMPRKKAETHMKEVHEKGKSLVWSGPREQAELYVQQLHHAMLLATMERAK
jgi:ATP-dependent Clp protease adaptor protein ClpS